MIGQVMTGRVIALALGASVFASGAIMPAPAVAAEAETPLGATMTGETTLATDAGRIEARLLTGVAVKQAARRIVDDIGTDFSSLTVVVLPVLKEAQDSPSVIGGAGWDVLQGTDQLPVVGDMVRVRDQLDRFGQRYAAIAAAGVRSCRSSVQPERGEKDVLGTIGSILTGLEAATPLLNLFKQDFLYQPISTRVRDGMLVTAVRGEIAARRKSAPAPTATRPQTFGEVVDALGARLASLPDGARCGEDDGGAEPARAALASEFAGFLGELSEPGLVPGLSKLAAAEDQLRRYGPRPATLVLAIDADGASLVQRSNLGTMFGAESTTVSSGIVVSYEFYEPHSGGINSLKGAGVLSCVSGAVGMRAIHNARKIRSRATCY